MPHPRPAPWSDLPPPDAPPVDSKAPMTNENEANATNSQVDTNPESEQTTDPQTVQDEIIAKLKEENDGLKDAMMRTMAEAQNIRRRTQEQMAAERKYGAENLVRELLPVLDNFARTLQAVEKGASLESLTDGVASIEKQMMKALESAGVMKIESAGQPFDPEIHEALVTHETDEHPDETVLDEIEAGYKLHDRIIRPARVRVSKKPE